MSLPSIHTSRLPHGLAVTDRGVVLLPPASKGMAVGVLCEATPQLCVDSGSGREQTSSTSGVSGALPASLADAPAYLTRQDFYELLLGGYLERMHVDPKRQWYDLVVSVPCPGIYTNGIFNKVFQMRVGTDEAHSNGKYASQAFWITPEALPHQSNQIERVCLFLRPHLEEMIVADPSKLKDSLFMYAMHFKLRNAPGTQGSVP